MNFVVPYKRFQKVVNLALGILWLVLGVPKLVTEGFSWYGVVLSLFGILYVLMAYKMYSKNYIEVTPTELIKNGILRTEKMKLADLTHIENRKGVRLIFYTKESRLILVLGYLKSITEIQQWLGFLNKPYENV